MMIELRSVDEAIRSALLTGDKVGKVFAARKVARDWRLGRLEYVFDCSMPTRPNWPDNLEIRPPREMPKRGKGTLAGRIALWHSLAHIEFVAIDLALDMAGRFGEEMGESFVSDFLAVAADEAMHFALIERKLDSLGSSYGQLPVHDGLWSAASATAYDVAARLAIVPMVLEARALDITPATLQRVQSQGDENGAKILTRILDDEIRHVAVGSKHFHRACATNGQNPQKRWQNLVREHLGGAVKPPFNDSARLAGGLPREYYVGLV